MKRILLFIFCAAALAPAARAQQRQQYTQFMFNKLAYNPGYPGSQSMRATAQYRNQWMGFEGAPTTLALAFSTPLLNRKAGLGVGINHQEIGISKISTVEVSLVPWMMKLYYGELRFGLFQFSLGRLTQNWNDPRIVKPQPDPSIIDNNLPPDARSKTFFNIGAGLYYSAPGWYAGVAMPRMLNRNIDVSENGSDEAFISTEVQYLNLMAGYDFDLADGDLILTPQVLFQASPRAPFSLELNLSTLVRDRFYGGATFRFGGETNSAGESIGALAGMQATEQLFFCLSYDFSLTRLRRYNSGSIEALVRFTLGEDVLDDPRAIEDNTPWK